MKRASIGYQVFLQERDICSIFGLFATYEDAARWCMQRCIFHMLDTMNRSLVLTRAKELDADEYQKLIDQFIHEDYPYRMDILQAPDEYVMKTPISMEEFFAVTAYTNLDEEYVIVHAIDMKAPDIFYVIDTDPTPTDVETPSIFLKRMEIYAIPSNVTKLDVFDKDTSKVTLDAPIVSSLNGRLTCNGKSLEKFLVRRGSVPES